MYCPRCSIKADEGQRFCRGCGMNLGIILDSIEGKQKGPLDFETLKRDLRELGSNLRTGFEEAGVTIKRTHRLGQNPAPQNQPGQALAPDFSKEFNKALKKVKAAHDRKYSFQQATLKVLSGGGLLTAWYYILNAASRSGLFNSIEQIIQKNTGEQIIGIEPVLRLMWLFALIPIAVGVGHLINGIFFAPKKIEETAEAAPPPGQFYGYSSPVFSSPMATTTSTNELQGESTTAKPQQSIVEDETLRF